MKIDERRQAEKNFSLVASQHHSLAALSEALQPYGVPPLPDKDNIFYYGLIGKSDNLGLVVLFDDK